MRTLLLHISLTVLLSYIFFNKTALIPYNGATAIFVFLIFFILIWSTTYFNDKTYFRKLPKAVSFFLYFLKKVLIANIKLAYDILTPDFRMHPTVVAMPLLVKTDIEITLLACMVTLTPGSLSLDVSDDKKILYIHTLYMKDNDVAKYKEELKNGFERRILELTA